jgi:predicted RNA-binding protein with RPS1 domain
VASNENELFSAEHPHIPYVKSIVDGIQVGDVIKLKLMVLDNNKQ